MDRANHSAPAAVPTVGDGLVPSRATKAGQPSRATKTGNHRQGDNKRRPYV